jgi:hypothetical protein
MDNEEEWAFKDKSKIIHMGDFKRKEHEKNEHFEKRDGAGYCLRKFISTF